MVASGKFKVGERIYSEPDSLGHKHLRFREGQEISWADAEAAGLTDPSRIPSDQVQVTLPRHVYKDDAVTGQRTLVHRAGSVISLEEAQELGIGEEEDDNESEKTETRTPPREPRTATSSRERPVRTVKVPDPET